MPVFQLPDSPLFPSTHLAESNGLLAVGGDLKPQRLVQAYAQGIFPWYSDDSPILWHAPPHRMVLPVDGMRVNRSTRKAVRGADYQVTLDRAFDDVVARCAAIARPGQDSTWITAAMKQGYGELHRLGLAHSVETWHDQRLVGGLYGVSLGAAFFGESMFSLQSNASKVALVRLVRQLARWDFSFVDCQMHTALLESFGGFEIPREAFEEMLAEAIERPTRQGTWRFDDAPEELAPRPSVDAGGDG